MDIALHRKVVVEADAILGKMSSCRARLEKAVSKLSLDKNDSITKWSKKAEEVFDDRLDRLARGTRG